jgi:TonB family protein
MALTGQLSDMSLAELIEFFCNQRKTGRLKIDYQRGHSVFFIKEGELVDAKVGALSGPEAVYFSLTLPNAAFDFSPDVQATRRTIHHAWTQVVLEGLRRLDEGISPTEADAFGKWEPSETELAQMLDQVEHLDSQAPAKTTKERAARAAAPGKVEAAAGKVSPSKDNSPEPFSMMVESAGSGGGSKKKFVVMGVGAAVVLACAVAAVPLLNRAPAKPAAGAAATAPAAPSAEPAPAEAQPAPTSESAEATPESADPAAAADAARREERERKERERRRREEAAKKEEAAGALNPDEAAKPATPTGPKSVRVTVTYDEAGRVTAASVAGATPGAEAYGSTAVRVARGKRFPAGKPGSTVVTIPVN